jgi:polysaccharide chain length determinant protein (PEP-CTERM system associated)
MGNAVTEVRSVKPLVNQVLDDVRGSWRFRWYALGTTIVVAVTGWLIVFSLPDRYEAVASVFVDTRTPLKPALQGLAVEQDVDSQLNFVRQSLLAGPNLQRVARKGGVLPPYDINPRLQEQLIDDMSRRIDIGVYSASGREEDHNAGTIYRIIYQDRDRARALRVVGILLDTFVTETLSGKREGSENAQQFLEVQIGDYEKRLRAAEDRLAQFKARHIGLMPTEQGGYFAQLQKEQETVSNLKTKLAEAQSRRGTLTRQLHGDVAIAASGSAQRTPGPGGGPGALDTLSRIDEAQAHLDELLLRFTEHHPDVIAARQTLEDLKRRRAAEIEGLRHGDATAAAVSRASNNPVYQSVQLALNQVDVDIADLNTEIAQHAAKVVELRRLLDTAPQVEAEFAQLNRDYDVNKAQYTALLGNLQKARLGERADNAGSVRFEVVQPPTAPLGPVWPIRPVLLTGCLLAALAAGAALAYGLHHLRPVVTSGTVLSQTLGVPVLGLVSVAFPERARAAMRRDVLGISFAGGFLVLAFVVAVFLSLHGFRFSLTALKQLAGS